MSLQGILDALAENVTALLERVNALETEVATLKKGNVKSSSSSTSTASTSAAAKKTASSSS